MGCEQTGNRSQFLDCIQVTPVFPAPLASLVSHRNSLDNLAICSDTSGRPREGKDLANDGNLERARRANRCGRQFQDRF